MLSKGVLPINFEITADYKKLLGGTTHNTLKPSIGERLNSRLTKNYLADRVVKFETVGRKVRLASCSFRQINSHISKLKTNYKLKIMKRLPKLPAAATSRSFRSTRKIETPEIEETVSKYFVAEILEPSKEQTKKRKSIEIKYEEPKREKLETSSGNWMPTNWEATLAHVKEMRKHRTAAVDHMGCHTCADPNASASVSRFQSLVALMLSSQTKDQVTYAAMERLKAHGCTPEIVVDTSDDLLGKLIYPVGFWKRKVQYIKRTSEILIKEYKGDIPNTIKGLCSLPGVGPKMGHICMQVAWGETSGIGVDTHVHRICNRLGWVEKETKSPEATRGALESWLPRDLWSEVNHLLVGFGQEICTPRFPKCGECLNRGICPYAKGTRKD